MPDLAAHLVERRILSLSEAQRASELSKQLAVKFSTLLPQLGLISEMALAEELAGFAGCEMANASLLSGELPEISDLNPDWLARHLVLPISQQDEILTAAMADPTDEQAMAALTFVSGREIKPVVAPASNIADRITRLGAGTHMDSSQDRKFELAQEDIERLIEGTSEAPVIRLVHDVIADAVRRGASDVHLEPMARHLAVRFRIDGRLTEVAHHPYNLAGPVASRIKVMASLDISETRLPQDGRLRYTFMGEEIDVRVSTSPIANGESIVLRLLGRSRVPLELAEIGLPYALLTKFIAALQRPNGIILVTGPTGSGKTTTLYAALNRLRRPEVKILTVEDPVEILLEGVNQVQVQPEIGLDYASSLRAFLRQDPDILMIGEIRDRETADIALRAALTGHLVLSTLHTNSALGAFTRLNDIGIDNFLAASTVVASVAQRLMRTLCEHCRIPRAATKAETALFAKFGIAAVRQIHEPGQCARCGTSGYAGRAPIMEFVGMDEQLRELVQEGRAEDYAVPPSERLSAHALQLVAAGRTSLAEALRITGAV